MQLFNVHNGLPSPLESTTHVVKGTYEYYHYRCDGLDDVGWGCGYRTLQTICSWIRHNCSKTTETVFADPTLSEIQDTLVKMGDKQTSFSGSKQWIGSFEICLFLDHRYGVSSKIIHARSGKDVASKFEGLVSHFHKFGCPVMIGGDTDAASKALLGVGTDGVKQYFLILDPHFVGDADIRYLQNNGWIEWKDEECFMKESFYNFCLPQCKPD